MEILLYVIIGVLLVIVLVLLFRPRKVEVPAIEELESKLRFALASAASVKEIQDALDDLPQRPSGIDNPQSGQEDRQAERAPGYL